MSGVIHCLVHSISTGHRLLLYQSGPWLRTPAVICATCESRHAAATSSTGRDGFSSHEVSSPLRNAMISIAFRSGSMSPRAVPLAWAARMPSAYSLWTRSIPCFQPVAKGSVVAEVLDEQQGEHADHLGFLAPPADALHDSVEEFQSLPGNGAGNDVALVTNVEGGVQQFFLGREVVEQPLLRHARLGSYLGEGSSPAAVAGDVPDGGGEDLLPAPLALARGRRTGARRPCRRGAARRLPPRCPASGSSGSACSVMGCARPSPCSSVPAASPDRRSRAGRYRVDARESTGYRLPRYRLPIENLPSTR